MDDGLAGDGPGGTTAPRSRAAQPHASAPIALRVPHAVRQLLEYNHRGFHPNDRDTSELIARWRAALFGSDGQLTDLLAS